MQAFKKKILTPQAAVRLLSKLARSKSRKKSTLVFTNGCFDLLHPGHVAYLERARNQGTALIVAVNSDRSVRALKGPTRPINTLKDRLQVMAALESVSYVTWFDEDTPLKIITKLTPDVLVKGGDWKPRDIVGSEHVLENGGKVRSLKFVPGKSTTSTLAKIAAL